MEENKQAKRSYRRNKPVTKSKVYAIRLDIDLVDFVREQPNMSKFINELIRKEKESCFQWFKDTKMKANHNKNRTVMSNVIAVSNGSKILK